jgi:hypothetical protein
MNSKSRLWLPSFADLFFCCVFLRLTLSADSWLLNDADTGYHIRAGEYILTHFTVPTHDIFSYITPPLPWIAHEWLSEVIMALVHKLTGLTGMVIFFSLLMAVTYFIFMKFSQSLNSNSVLTALIVLLAIASSSVHWLARPHIFSLLLTVVWYAILENYQYKDKDRLLWLPFLMLLWVNLHGGFILGLLLLGVFWFGNLMATLSPEELKRNTANEKFKKLTVITALCVLFSLLNPRGYEILVFPFKMVTNRFVVDNVTEFLSPNFHVVLPFLYLLLVTVTVLSISRIPLNAMELMLVVLFTYMSLYSSRYIPLFAVIIVPILLRQVQSILRNLNNRPAKLFQERSRNLELIDASARGHLWPALSVVGVCALALYGQIEFKFDEKTKPVAAVEFLKRERVTGNMFNDDEFGDYLIYAAWPEYKVFFDGRSDMYGETWGTQYLKVVNVQRGWEQVLEKNSISWVFAVAGSPLSTVLAEKGNWHLIYADKVAEIFVNSNGGNRHLIEKYSTVKPLDSKKERSLDASGT